MEQKKPLVSICIPTYNRYEQLKKTIESITRQSEFLNGKVEIVISDNASDDLTEKVGREYSEIFSNIKYFKNTKNVRDENFPLVLSKANGVLRKLHNDTFILEKGALKELCGLAERYQDTKPVLFLTNGNYGEKEDVEMNFHDFVVAESFHVTWIASFSIWDSDCESLEKDTEGCELFLWQVRKLYELAYKKNHIVVCNQKLGEILSVPKKNISYGLYKVFYCNFMQLLRKYRNILEEADFESVEKSLLYDFFTQWIIRWELANTDMLYSKEEDLKALVFQQYQNKPYWKEYLKYYKRRFRMQKVKTMIKMVMGKNSKNEK